MNTKEWLNKFLGIRETSDEVTCTICNKNTNHVTKNHVCNVCNEKGKHSARSHCQLCKKLDHTSKDHTCERCNVYEKHEHSCNYCLENHKTEEHECQICKQKGHNYDNHQQKCICTTCKIIGHIESDLHFDCDKCGYTIINDSHVWCDKCNSCTFNNRKHVDVCQYCSGCMASSNHCYECNYEPRCIKCYKLRNNPEEYDITAGIRIKNNT